MAKPGSERLAKSMASSSLSSSPTVEAHSGSSQPAGQAPRSGSDTVRYSLHDLPPARAGEPPELTDEQIAAAVRDDPDAAPIADEDFWAGAELVTPPQKEAISIRVDKDVLDWFRSLGRGYQTRMNMVLRGYMNHHTKRKGAG